VKIVASDVFFISFPFSQLRGSLLRRRLSELLLYTTWSH